MNKKIIILVIIVIFIALGILLGIKLYRDRKPSDINVTGKKVLVVYYSAQGHTENIAKLIASNLNADIFKIEPKEEYTSADLNYNNSNSRVVKEHDDESLRNIELKDITPDSWNEYDTIIIGYPIWWGIAAWPINNLIKENDFTNKTIIPFCTSVSSGLGNSDILLKDISNGGNWIKGTRFSSNASNQTINEWTKGIKIK